MAQTEAQIMASVYKEVDGIGDSIERSRAKVEKLCEGMPGTFTRAAQSALARGIRGKLVVKAEEAPTKTSPIRQVSGG